MFHNSYWLSARRPTGTSEPQAVKTIKGRSRLTADRKSAARRVLAPILVLGLVAAGLGACGVEPPGSALGPSVTILAGGENVNPSARAGLEPGVNVVDPYTREMINEEAMAALGDRYVSMWYAEDQIALVLGVYAPTEADMVFLRDLTATHWLVAVECPVGLPELNAAADRVWAAAGDDMISGSFDRDIGRLRLGVTWDQVDRIVGRINADSNGLLAVTPEGEIPASKPGQVVVVVEPDEIDVPD